MKTLRKVPVKVVYTHYIPEPQDMEPQTLYISEEFETSNHLCLCGCGEQTPLPFDKVRGWNLIKESNGTISLTPSIGNYQIPCRSHYIITKSVANFV